jgi:hypothetical protein
MLYRAIGLVLDSETLWDFLSSTYKTMDKVQNKPNSSVNTYFSFIWRNSRPAVEETLSNLQVSNQSAGLELP